MSDADRDLPLKIAVIGGSGLGETFSGDGATAHAVDTPFGPPSGSILETTYDGTPVLLLQRHGPGHLLNPSAVPYRANLFALKALGATHVLASGAVGSLREEYRPRDLVIPDSSIDKTHGRAKTFFDALAVHVEFADPFCPVLRSLLLEAAGESAGGDFQTHDGGCYVCMEGPQFSTRAESHMHRLWGGDVVGMTLLPEAKLAREAELPYAAVCLVTDYDSWRPKEPEAGHDPAALLNEIIGHLKQASANAGGLIRRAVKLMAQRPEALAACPATRALDLAIWSDKAKVDAAEIARLRPIFGRHFAAG